MVYFDIWEGEIKDNATYEIARHVLKRTRATTMVSHCTVLDTCMLRPYHMWVYVEYCPQRKEGS